MKQILKEYFDYAYFSSFQSKIALLLILAGIIIAAICLFAIPPFGVISSSAISVVSELLILAGALMGVKLSFDTKLKKFETEVINKVNNTNNK